MSETIASVIADHRVVYHSVDALVFEPAQVDKVVVSFTGMKLNRYERWSWFHDQYLKGSNTLYIVFKDDDHAFYLDRDSTGPVSAHHADFILDKLTKYNLDSKQLYTVGSSMGGYAAVYFAFRLNARAATSVSPLVDIASARLLPPGNLWERKMLELGNEWIDLDQYVLESNNNPEVFLMYGKYPPDIAAANKLISALDVKNIVHTEEHVDQDTHGDFLSYDKMFKLIDTWILAQ